MMTRWKTLESSLIKLIIITDYLLNIFQVIDKYIIMLFVWVGKHFSKSNIFTLITIEYYFHQPLFNYFDWRKLREYWRLYNIHWRHKNNLLWSSLISFKYQQTAHASFFAIASQGEIFNWKTEIVSNSYQ